MVNIGPTWLTRQGFERAQTELAELLLAYRTSQTAMDVRSEAEDHDQRRWQKRRIRRLQELLLTANVGEPPDDGIAEQGMVLSVRFADQHETETFLLGDRGAYAYSDMEVYSPDSPIGRALLGARIGNTRTYQLPDGGTMSVTLLNAEPYRDRRSMHGFTEDRT